ncbi:hypothetical protein HNV08_06690 [Winogradskyella eckloniae]|uniref:hypothetical protein n=1 Tax=Winogradskyella eckloniae TaxID=1089306 RepID=UPI001566F47B|nr:hypothetical protein [Winogradskyella eckloniae]NRD19730.1 hypothetical protein [Winogradskyella eckloniae]
MKQNVDMNNKVKNTIDSAESIQKVDVSPFFKANVMHKIRNTSEEIQDATWSWFTPKLQLATLVCVVVLNIIAFNSLQKSDYIESVNSFAESYGLSTTTESTILN